MELPPVKQLVAMGWLDELPVTVGMAFLGVAVTSRAGLAGDEMWDHIDAFCDSAQRAKLTQGEKEHFERIGSRFEAIYGSYEKTAGGLVGILVDIGLVTRHRRNGLDVLDIPDTFPLPCGDGKHTRASSEGVTIRARPCGNGDKVRVELDDLPEVSRLVDRGWSRHLPMEVAAMFMVVAAVCVGGCVGDLMWHNIRDLYRQARRCGPPCMPPPLRREVAARFAKEYGKPYGKTARGAVDVLVDLGLLMRYERDGQEALGIPESLPYPDSRLALDDHEKALLASRRSR